MSRKYSFLWQSGENRMKIGILAVQGAFLEHRKKLEALGAQCVEIRQKGDLQEAFDGLVLPGGESTVQGKLLRELDMAEACVNDPHVYFGTLPVTVKRNAYGRQLGSFHTMQEMKGIGTVPMTFIRAPYVEKADPAVEILARAEGKIVAVRYGRQYGLAFHPELDTDNRIHELFLKECRK